MKKLYLLLLSTSILLASCTRNDDGESQDGPFGEVSVSLCATEATESLSAGTKAASDTVVLDPADFKIEFVNSQGLVSKRYDRYGDMPQTVKLNVGGYKLRAYYGTAASGGFGAPYFLGEKTFTVDGQTNKNISVTCSLANAKLDVEYGGQIRQDYTDFRVEVKPASLDAVTFSKTEIRPAYFPVGKLGIAIYLSSGNNGERVYNYPTPVTVEARQFMHLKIDTKDAKGDLTLSIHTDNSTIDTTVTVELASFTRPKEAPSIALEGFDESGKLSFAEGIRQPAAMNVTAKGGIKTCLVTVQSPALLAKGWPASFDLAAVDAGTSAVLKRDGLRWTEKMQNASMATIDFTNLTETLTADEASAAQYAFTVNVTDTVRNTQTSGDVKAVLSVTPPVFSLSAIGPGDLWTDRATLTVNVPSGVMRKAVAEWKTAGGSWTPCTGADSVRNGTSVTFDACGLPAASALQFRVRYNDRYTGTREGTTEPIVQLPNSGLENWTEWYNKTINNGGKIAVTAGTKQLTKNVTASEAGGGWATTNRKTVPTAPANENTWYVVPSVLPATGSSGTGALIRNVAWDHNGEAPKNASWGNIGFQASLSKLDPPSIGFRSAGKLFLGSYAYDHAGNTETYTEGLAFASRPSALTGYYKYTAKNGDAAGKVSVTVEHRAADGSATTLAHTEQELPASGEYGRFTVPLVYTDKSLKATHIKVMFASSAKASYDQSTESQAIQTEDIKADAVSLGSELYIDELNLNY